MREKARKRALQTNAKLPQPLEFKGWQYTVTLNIIYKYTDVRKNYPEESSQVAAWSQVNGVKSRSGLNLQKGANA